MTETKELIERLRQATMRFDWGDLPDDAAIPAVPLLRKAADALERVSAERDEVRVYAEGYRIEMKTGVRDLIKDLEATQSALAAERARREKAERLLADLARNADSFWAFLQGEYGVRISSEDQDDHNIHGFFASLTAARDHLASPERNGDQQDG